MVESRTRNRKALSPPSIPRRGALEQGTEPPTAPCAPQQKCTAPGVCSHCVCVCVCSLLCVCTLDG